MPEFIASRAFDMDGKRYAIGAVVPVDRMPERLRRQLVDAKKIEPHRIVVKAAPPRSGSGKA